MKHYHYIAVALLAASAWIATRKIDRDSSGEHGAPAAAGTHSMASDHSAASIPGLSHTTRKHGARSEKQIAAVSPNEQVLDPFWASLDALYANPDEPQKQHAMEVLREHWLTACHHPQGREKLKEFFQSGPAGVVNELLFDVSAAQHPLQASLWRAAAERDDSEINSAILLHLEQQSGETFDDIASALSWAENRKM
jgi:hypothetical protein